MNKLEDITFDDVLKKLETAEWKMEIRMHEQEAGSDYETVRYYAQVGDLYVHIGTQGERGIFGWHRVHELIISSRYGGGGDYGETLATFTGSRSLFSGEKRRIERVFGEIYKDLRVMYERDKEKRRAEGLKKERRKSEEIRDKLRKTFK